MHHVICVRRDLGVVRDDDDRCAVGGERGEELEDRCRGARVEVAGGLVGDEERRSVGKRACDGGALLLAAGERGGELVTLRGDADALEERGGTRVALGARHGADEVQRDADVLARGERGEELEELEDDADVGAAPAREGVLVEGVECRLADADVAACGAIEPGDQIEECRLARPRASREGDELAGMRAEGDVAEGDDRLAGGAGEVPGDGVELDEGRALQGGSGERTTS